MLYTVIFEFQTLLLIEMVLHFPAKLTEEEEALQLKYAKLRRKKKQLQEVNKPKQEPEQNKVTYSLNVVTSCSR